MSTGAAVLSTTQVTLWNNLQTGGAVVGYEANRKRNTGTETYLGESRVRSNETQSNGAPRTEKRMGERGLKGIRPVRNKAAQPSNNSPKVRPQRAGRES